MLLKHLQILEWDEIDPLNNLVPYLWDKSTFFTVSPGKHVLLGLQLLQPMIEVREDSNTG